MPFIYLLLSIVTIAIGAYFLVSKAKQNKIKQLIQEKTSIQLNLKDTTPPKKNFSKDAVIREAESLFKTLKLKYPDSPLPYKTLGDFYLSKGFLDHALLKYQLMIQNLNADLKLEKLNSVIEFLQLRNKPNLIQSINSYYQQG